LKRSLAKPLATFKMKIWIKISLSVLILSSCGQKKNEDKENPTRVKVQISNSNVSDYSEEFHNHFQESKLTLKEDSILFPGEKDSMIALIPEYIPRNQNVKFEAENGSSITIRQINYTDIEFEIEYNDEKFRGKASLFPYFYLGMETVGFSDGEYMITHYYVTETDNFCLDFIGLGNQNIAKDKSENVYALVSVSGDSCEDELNALTNKKLKVLVSSAQNNHLPDPFEIEYERNYRLSNPHLIKPDSNYLEYWCSIEILNRTHTNIENLSLSEVAAFLATFHPSCTTNIEYSEWSNELLFKVLSLHPESALNIIDKNSSLYRNQIATELANPIHDNIEISQLISKLESVEIESFRRTRDIIIGILKEK